MPAVAALVVLAAGEGKRMRSATPKVLHEVCGRTLLGHVLAAAAPLGAARTIVVVGHGREAVTAWLAAEHPQATAVVQPEQNGTGHALRLALEAAPDLVDGTVVVLCGDMPLLSAETVAALVEEHTRSGAATTVLSARMTDPTGYGRVLRDADGAVVGIVEHRDATDDQLAVDETNSGAYAFAAAALRAALGRLTTDNSQGEEYLTDVIALHVADGLPVRAVVASADETAGVNDRAQLAAAGAVLRDRTMLALMRSGVSVVDPTTTWVDVTVEVEPDARIEPFTLLHGRTRVATGAVVGPYSRLTDTVVGAGATVLSATCVGADIGPEATVGPYTYLRPGTVLGRGAKAGGFVEMKATTVGEGSKVPHLSYVGDAQIGAGTNVGAGTITCNYDGERKHRTTVGDNVFVGSGTMLVAPVELGDDSYVAAGSAVTDDVPPGALAIGRARQTNKDGWRARRDATRASNPPAAHEPDGEAAR